MAELTPERRRKVAEACGETPHDKTLQGWDPGDSIRQLWLMGRKCAQLIEALPEETIAEQGRKFRYWGRLGTALATNNVLAIEELCAELLEKNDG
jgi:hypothetical protein